MNDEMYSVQDMDADIQQKEQLVEDAKNLQQTENLNEAQRGARDLKRRWKKISYWESEYEDQLRDEFEGYLDVIYSKREELYKEVEKVKNSIIEKAKEIANSEELNARQEEFNSLMDQWKAAGRAGREKDDALWEEFQAARDLYYKRKKEAWEKMHEGFEKAKEVKEGLIQKAKELSGSEEWRKTSDAMKDLMDQWKAAGHAGNRVDDALWNEFNEARQIFYTRRNEHYDEMQKQRNENYEKKLALIDRAKEIADTKDYSRENTAKMKELSGEWKKIGFCGREHDDEVWETFRSVNDDYFDGLKKLSEERQADWKNRMVHARDRKLDLIENQKRQIKRLNDDMLGLVSEGTMASIQNEINEKEDFIKELEQQIADIDSRLED